MSSAQQPLPLPQKEKETSATSQNLRQMLVPKVKGLSYPLPACKFNFWVTLYFYFLVVACHPSTFRVIARAHSETHMLKNEWTIEKISAQLYWHHLMRMVAPKVRNLALKHLASPYKQNLCAQIAPASTKCISMHNLHQRTQIAPAYTNCTSHWPCACSCHERRECHERRGYHEWHTTWLPWKAHNSIKCWELCAI